MWDFLTDPQNQQTLSWLGGGLAVVCGGLWAVLRFVLERRGRGAASPASAAAPSGSGVHIDKRRGMPPGHLVLILLALAGALVFAVSQAGNKVTVSDGIGVGGDVEGSSITNQ